METLIQANRLLHIALGFAGLAAWWIPVFTAKGKKVHVWAGRTFAVCAYAVGASAVLSPTLRMPKALLDGIPFQQLLAEAGFIVFLGYLGILTLNSVHFGVRVVRTRRDPARLDTPFLRLLPWAMPLGSLLVIDLPVAYWSPMSIILLVLASLGLLSFRPQLRYLSEPPRERMAWFFAHMEAMLGAGIAFHTAFLVFGSRVFFDLSLLGPYNWVPWVLPSVIGIAGGEVWKRSYQRKFGLVPESAPAADAQA